MRSDSMVHVQRFHIDFTLAAPRFCGISAAIPQRLRVKVVLPCGMLWLPVPLQLLLPFVSCSYSAPGGSAVASDSPADSDSSLVNNHSSSSSAQPCVAYSIGSNNKWDFEQNVFAVTGNG
jgi:hypothetical protein